MSSNPLPDVSVTDAIDAATQQPAQQPAQPGESAAADAAAPANLDLLLDVVLEASLRFGQREMLLRDILELHPGSVIELDRRVQEPAELIVAGRVIAHGEVVIVDGNYGLRITDVAQASQRLESLGT
jgi:flagellar motor switch protein FliN/FliY